MSSSHISRLRLIGIIFWLAGAAVITFGWMGMASEACVDCQMPYLLSGGAAGVGLIIVGSTLVLIATMHDVASRNAEKMAELFEDPEEETEPVTFPLGRATESTEDDVEKLEVDNVATEFAPEESASDNDSPLSESATTVMPKVPADSESKDLE